MLTTSEIAFAICFVIVFIIGMVWAYNKDSFYDKIHFKGASKTLAIIILVLVIMFLFVKMRHYI